MQQREKSLRQAVHGTSLMEALNADIENSDLTERARKLMETALNIALSLGIVQKYQRGRVDDGYVDSSNSLLIAKLEEGQCTNSIYASHRKPVSKSSMRCCHCLSIMCHFGTALDTFNDEGWQFLQSGVFEDPLNELGHHARTWGNRVSWVTHLPSHMAKNKYHMLGLTQRLLGIWDRMKRNPASIYLEWPRQETVANVQRLSGLQPQVFLAATIGNHDSSFPVNVPVPGIYLDFWKNLMKILLRNEYEPKSNNLSSMRVYP
jgi:hypothetical protein